MVAVALRRTSEIARCLSALHDRGEAHYALCPMNVIEKGEGGIELRNEHLMPLTHMSPEQTGRMNRRVDYRSDFYSLGVMFYEMLTGRLPFVADDRLELVHAHIARQPLYPSQVASRVPKTVSAITLKLLAKNAEDRYQSITGLLADLERCVAALDKFGEVPEFPLGESDHSDRLQISHKLYGREAEIGKLLAVFDRVAQSGSELLLVTGYSGVGKSSLVNEIHKPIVAKRGYFAEGKFDQLNRNVPYVAIGQAFRDLMRQLLTESDAQIADWKTRILEAVGPNGKLLTDVLPELVHVIGVQPDIPELGALEAQNRLNYVVLNFVRVFAKRQHPLVLFLDDLQWVDAASLSLLSAILAAPDKPCLLVIGAYRDNEVALGSALLTTIEEIGKQCAITRIEVKPLNENDVSHIIADTVKSDQQMARTLAHLVYSKTIGNPFFVGQLLTSLYHEKLLTLLNGKWTWDIAEIEARKITDDVVDLLSGELKRLPQPTQHLLTLAACIGIRFDLPTLAVVAQQAAGEIRDQLQPAVAAGLLLDNTLSGNSAGGSRFLHDRVQQAAYGHLDTTQAKQTHLSIGRLLFRKFTEKEGSLFDVANQFGKALDLIDTREERLTMARLYLKAARQAKKNSAFSLALQYAEAGVQLAGENFGGSEHELCCELALERMESLMLNRRYSEMERYGETLLNYALSDVQRVNVHGFQVRSLIQQQRMGEAGKLGLKILEMYGIRISARLGKFGILLGKWRTSWLMAGRKPADLIDLPVLNDPVKIALGRISTHLGEALLASSPQQLFPAFVVKQVQLAIRDGYSPVTAPSFGLYGLLLVTGIGEIDLGHAFATLALDLQRKHGASLHYCMFLLYGFVDHWKNHLSETCGPFLKAPEMAVEEGEFSRAAYCLITLSWGYLLSSEHLPATLQRIGDALNFMSGLKQQFTITILEPAYDHAAKLTGVPRWRESGDKFQLVRDTAEFALFYEPLFEAFNQYYFDSPSLAQAAMEKAEPYGGAAYGLSVAIPYNLFRSLILLGCSPDMKGNEAKQALRKVGTLQKQMKKWAQHAPMNYLHKWQLVEAEHCRVLGKAGKAAEYYDLAIAGAKENKYINEEALANELAGAFYLALGKATIARAYLEEAHTKYQQWGAFAKVKQLEGKYAELLARVTAQSSQTEIESPIEFGGQQPHPATEPGLDINTVVKAAQTLSGEIQLKDLLEKLMRLLIENAGAEQGMLLLEREGELRVQASVEQDEIQVLQDLPLTAATLLSPGIINYVRRTGELIVLNDPAGDHRFSQDAYLARTQPKSVLCLPLLKQSQLVGVLYLENRLTADVFSTERCELLQMISAQIAISLENAQLYGELEHKVELRTQDLSRANEELTLTLESLKQAQKQLVQSEKMASLGGLVAGVAHEINTPVGIGVTAASHLEDETKRLLSLYQQGQMKKTDLEQYLSVSEQSSRMILNNLERAADLIHSFKQVAVDQSSENRRRFKVKSYLEEVLTSLRPVLKKTKISCSIDCPDDIEVESFPGAFSQVVTNLVMNALKHAYDDSSEGVIRIALRKNRDHLELEFSDDGKGMSAEVLDKIFDPFFTTKRGAGGSGLGMHIVYNLITQTLQGGIECRSQPGQGTTFNIHWPIGT